MPVCPMAEQPFWRNKCLISTPAFSTEQPLGLDHCGYLCKAAAASFGCWSPRRKSVISITLQKCVFPQCFGWQWMKSHTSSDGSLVAPAALPQMGQTLSFGHPHSWLELEGDRVALLLPEMCQGSPHLSPAPTCSLAIYQPSAPQQSWATNHPINQTPFWRKRLMSSEEI